jgi:hypothetical protein
LSAPIIPKLPDHFDPREGFDIPDDLVGATIIGFGTCQSESDPLLVIEYVPKNGAARRRVELAFNDRGMWVHFPQSG